MAETLQDTMGPDLLSAEEILDMAEPILDMTEPLTIAETLLDAMETDPLATHAASANTISGTQSRKPSIWGEQGKPSGCGNQGRKPSAWVNGEASRKHSGRGIQKVLRTRGAQNLQDEAPKPAGGGTQLSQVAVIKCGAPETSKVHLQRILGPRSSLTRMDLPTWLSQTSCQQQPRTLSRTG